MPRRVETGVLQFPEDWPGVFIRGDNAMGFALTLEPVIRFLENQRVDGLDMQPYLVHQLKALHALLTSCYFAEDAQKPGDPENLRTRVLGYLASKLATVSERCTDTTLASLYGEIIRDIRALPKDG